MNGTNKRGGAMKKPAIDKDNRKIYIWIPETTFGKRVELRLKVLRLRQQLRKLWEDIWKTTG